jgi:hypothetical protein
MPHPPPAPCRLGGLPPPLCQADAFRLVDPPTAPDQATRVRIACDPHPRRVAERGGFPSRAACEEARRIRTEAAVERAHATAGEEAKYDLDLRRAVNARCVRNR